MKREVESKRDVTTDAANIIALRAQISGQSSSIKEFAGKSNLEFTLGGVV